MLPLSCGSQHTRGEEGLAQVTVGMQLINEEAVLGPPD